MEPGPWFYVGAGGGLAMVVWSAIRPPWSWWRLFRHAIGTVIASVLAIIVLFSLNPENGLGPYAGSCVANLLAIEKSKSAWARESGKSAADIPQDSDLFGAGKFIRSKPACPGGGSYLLGAVDQEPNCSVMEPSHCRPDPRSKDYREDAAAKAFFVLCGLVIVAFLQMMAGAWQAGWHNRPFEPVLFVLALVLLILGVFIAVPNFANVRLNHAISACSANLRQIQGAKKTWAMEDHQPPTAVPTESDLVGRTRYFNRAPVCPMNGTYHFGAVNEKPICSWGGPGHRWEHPSPLSPRRNPARNMVSLLLGLSLFAVVPGFNGAWESRHRRRPPATP